MRALEVLLIVIVAAPFLTLMQAGPPPAAKKKGSPMVQNNIAIFVTGFIMILGENRQAHQARDRFARFKAAQIGHRP